MADQAATAMIRFGAARDRARQRARRLSRDAACRAEPDVPSCGAGPLGGVAFVFRELRSALAARRARRSDER